MELIERVCTCVYGGALWPPMSPTADLLAPPPEGPRPASIQAPGLVPPQEAPRTAIPPQEGPHSMLIRASSTTLPPEGPPGSAPLRRRWRGHALARPGRGHTLLVGRGGATPSKGPHPCPRAASVTYQLREEKRERG
jgi:hypothetical protein